MEEKRDKQERFFFKGKRVTEKVYRKRCLDQKLGKNIRIIYGTKSGTYNIEKCNLKSDLNYVATVAEGRRIIHMKTLGDQLICSKCKSILSLQNIVSAKRYGLASEFDIKCRKCKKICKVSTDKLHAIAMDKQPTISMGKQHGTSNEHNSTMKHKHYDTNTKAVIDSQMEQGYRSEVQERALVVSLQMFNLILERGVCLLKSQLESDERPRLVVGEDMQILLPAIKIWCDWMLCHSTVWNPPPSCTDYRVGPTGDAWNRLATMVNLLEKLEYVGNLLIQAKDAEGRADELKLVKLPEDTTLSGFTPLMSNPQDPFYADKKEDMEVVQVCLRIHKILFFGQVFLCGLETPVLKLQKGETGISEYVSVVEASSTSTPGSPPEQSDSELMVESYSEDEDESSLTSPRLSIGDTGYDSVASSTTAPAGEIRSLIERKEELEKRHRRQDRHRQRVQAILQKSSLSVEIEVRPKHLVPDTNCFIDYLPELQSIAKATSAAQPIYTLMVPLVVLNELEGLSRGADLRDCGPTSRAALNPEHVARVAENARAGLTFARSRNPAIRCLTTRGTVLTSSSFTVEEDVCQDGYTGNDDRILATCLSLCKSNKDQVSSEEGQHQQQQQQQQQPRRVKRDVVLLTKDRNLRVKALARDVPVREVPDFIQWSGLG